MRYDQWTRNAPAPPIHRLFLTEQPRRVHLTARRRTRSFWCVGLSWYGEMHVRELAVHLGVLTLSIKWRPANG